MELIIEDDPPRPLTEEEIKVLRKKVKPLTMAQYCPVPRPVDLREMIQQAVAIEDIINHPPVKKEIPEMVYPTCSIWHDTARYAFIRQFLP